MKKKIDFRNKLSAMQLLIFLKDYLQTYVCRESGVYNHSGDDGKEDPPVPIPNTEVKLFYAESTYG